MGKADLGLKGAQQADIQGVLDRKLLLFMHIGLK